MELRKGKGWFLSFFFRSFFSFLFFSPFLFFFLLTSGPTSSSGPNSYGKKTSQRLVFSKLGEATKEEEEEEKGEGGEV